MRSVDQAKGVSGWTRLWGIARANGISYCGSDEQVLFLKSLCDSCETKPSDEVEGATLYDYSNKLGKFTSTDKGKGIKLKAEAQVKDSEEYQQCQAMLDKASGFNTEGKQRGESRRVRS